MTRDDLFFENFYPKYDTYWSCVTSAVSQSISHISH